MELSLDSDAPLFWRQEVWEEVVVKSFLQCFVLFYWHLQLNQNPLHTFHRSGRKLFVLRSLSTLSTFKKRNSVSHCTEGAIEIFLCSSTRPLCFVRCSSLRGPHCLLHSFLVPQEHSSFVLPTTSSLPLLLFSSPLLLPPQNTSRVQRISFAASDFSAGTRRNFLCSCDSFDSSLNSCYMDYNVPEKVNGVWFCVWVSPPAL